MHRIYFEGVLHIILCPNNFVYNVAKKGKRISVYKKNDTFFPNN